MPRAENPIDPDSGPIARFAADLRLVREKAGSPTYRVLAKRAGYSAGTLSVAAKGAALPSLDVTLAYVQACNGDPDVWRARWTELAALEIAPAPPAHSLPTVLTPAPATEPPAEPAGSPLRHWSNKRLGVAGLVLLAVVVSVVMATQNGSPSVGARQNNTFPGAPFKYDETVGPGCTKVFGPNSLQEIAEVEPDDSDDMSHAWAQGTSNESPWQIPNCSNALLYSQPTTEANPDQWQNDYVWKFFDVPTTSPCTFHIYIAVSPQSRYVATYDWTNGEIVDNWIDGNEFTVDQSAYVGKWYTDKPHTYASGKAFLMLVDQRGDNPVSANAPLTASEVSLTCSG